MADDVTCWMSEVGYQCTNEAGWVSDWVLTGLFVLGIVLFTVLMVVVGGPLERWSRRRQMQRWAHEHDEFYARLRDSG